MNFTPHTYQSEDPPGDVSFIIESASKLVIPEPQPFNENIKELTGYTDKLGKPVAAVLVSYHTGGVNRFEGKKIITRAMAEFMHSDHGQGMVIYFTNIFNGQMDLEAGNYDREIAAGSKLLIDGITYNYSASAVPGMPGSNISIIVKCFTPISPRLPVLMHRST